MGYKKTWTKLSPKFMKYSQTNDSGKSETVDISMTRAKNFLPVLYQGPQNRIDRYGIYEAMEQEPIISSSMDILSDYIGNIKNGKVFKLKFVADDIPDNHVRYLETLLAQWEEQNDFKKRIFSIVRDSMKYGDVFFLRDPDTGYLMKVNPYDVVGAVAGDMKIPSWWLIKNIDENAPLKLATNARNDVAGKNAIRTLNLMSGPFMNSAGRQNCAPTGNAPYGGQQPDENMYAIKSDDVVHISLNIDNATQYPFGVSTLENVYKLYVQKMLLQDCVIMLRVKNAPDRMIYKVPVGNIPRMMRRSYMERCRNEITQRRTPSKNADDIFNTMDVAYNAIALNEDIWLPIDAGQVQPSVEKLSGSNNLGELTDLNYWDMQIIRGVHVPESWQSYGTTKTTQQYSQTTASVLVEEDRFYKYCERQKNIMIEPFDKEFKHYVKGKGYQISLDGFHIEFNESSQLNKMTELDILQRELNNYQSAIGLPGMSKRFAMKKYLGFTESELEENRRMYAEENPDKLKAKDIDIPEPNKNQIPGLQSISASGVDDDVISSIKDALSDEFGGGQGESSNNGFGGGIGGGMGGNLGGEMDMGGGADFGAEMGGAEETATPTE